MEWRTSALALLFIVCSSVDAIVVSIPQKQYEFARGDNITLPCSYQSSITNPKQVVITWSVRDTAPDAQEEQVLTYFSSSDDPDISTDYTGRASLDMDIASGKANLKINLISLNDNKYFECRVQIPKDNKPTPAATVRLVVLVAPSKPICGIKGDPTYGQDVNLTCYSEEGSPTPTYRWDTYNVQNQPRPLPPRASDKGTILSLYNISKDTSGFFICTSSNKIRSDTCNFTLSVMPPSMSLGSTAGIAGGIAGVLLVLLIIIGCCCYCKKKNKGEEYQYTDAEYHKGDPEYDAPADGKEGTGDASDHMVAIKGTSEQREPPDDRKGQRSDYDDRRSDYDDRRSDYNDRRSDYDDRRSDYDDRRSDYNDRRSDYNDRRSDYNDRRRDDDDRRRDDDNRRRDNDDRRSDYDDRRSDYDNRRRDYDDRRSDYDDRRERYDDDRRYDDRRDRR